MLTKHKDHSALVVNPSTKCCRSNTATRFPRLWAVTLGAALGANPAFAGNLFLLSDTGVGPAGAARPPDGVPVTMVKPTARKLGLGLDTLSAEYQGYRKAWAQSAAPGRSFATQATIARVVGERVVIDAVAADDPQALKTALEALGAEVSAIRGRVVSARLPLVVLPVLEGVPTLKFARPALARTYTGLVTSQGDPAQRSDLARQAFDVGGTGSTIGVLSDSFDCRDGYAFDIGLGDLPSGVDLLDDAACPNSDEGRAMAQIVHDVAPGAELAFHTAFNGEADFAQGILELAAAGANIIVDDVIYVLEPMFQDGLVAQAVDHVAAAGVSYFSAAGNSGRKAYEARFDGSGIPGVFGGELHDFDPGPGVDTRLEIEQDDYTTYVMQWRDPYFSVSGEPGAQTDLDICFYSPPGSEGPVGCAADDNLSGDPVEVAGIAGARAVEISIEKSSGPSPDPVKLVMFGSISFTESYTGTHAGTLYGHANAKGATAVGASAYFLTAAFGENPPVLNHYSSAGGTPILFDTAGNAVLDVRDKPELTAPDGGNNTFFGVYWDTDNWPNFFGTSAAAPHAAGVAALLREADPSLTPDEITIVLQDTAVDIVERETGGFGGERATIGVGFDNDSGAGLVDAQAALAAIFPPRADLSITQSDAPDPVTAGGPLTYTVTVTNQGPDESENVVVNDTLPGGVTFASTTGCLEDPVGVPFCTLGNIPSGATASYGILVAVNGDASGTVTSLASVTSDTLDPDPADNSAAEATTVNAQGADLAVAVYQVTENPILKEPLTYRVRVTNNGPGATQGVTLVDSLSKGGSFESIDPRCSVDKGGTGGTLTCALAELASGASQELTITVVSTKSPLVNTAAVDAAGRDDPDSSNNTDTVTTVLDR